MQNLAKWCVQPDAEKYLRKELDTSFLECPEAEDYAQTLLSGCGVRLRDIIDHVSFSQKEKIPALEAAGWANIGDGIWRNSSGYFPDFVLGEKKLAFFFRAESVEHFLAANNLTATIEGSAGGPYRKALVFDSPLGGFSVIERNGYEKYDVPETPKELIRTAKIHLQSFRARRRVFSDLAKGFDLTENLVDQAVADLGQHWACDLFFRAERDYWMSHCKAGRIQKKQQDKMGVGWSNIDHHTYDSSRKWFYRTIQILEKLGFECRELFYAGHQAGWGSQVLEQPVLRSTIFADIDLAPEELDIDFPHIKLRPLEKFRRAGILCAMHGDSMLEGGLNHVAGMYDQKILRKQLKKLGVEMMKPFSDFPHLYQELTEGEWKPVEAQKVDALEKGGHISPVEAEDFRLNGSIWTHLENLERNDGYKGFNQPGIDGVLGIIDPRKNLDKTVNK